MFGNSRASRSQTFTTSESWGLLKCRFWGPHFQSIPFWSSWVESSNLHFYLVFTNVDAGGPENQAENLRFEESFCLKFPSLAHFL